MFIISRLYMCKLFDKNIDDIDIFITTYPDVHPYSRNDISICPYIEIMSSICIDLIAAGRRKKNRRTNKGTLPTNVAIAPRSPSCIRSVSRGLTITPYYVRHWSCHGIVDLPLLFFALVPDDRSCLAVARRLLRRGSPEEEEDGEEREKSPFGEKLRYSRARAWGEVARRALSLNRTIIHRKNGQRGAREREKLVQQTEAPLTLLAPSRFAVRSAPLVVSRLCLRRLSPSVEGPDARGWMLPKVVLIGARGARSLLWLVLAAAAVDPPSGNRPYVRLLTPLTGIMYER